MKNKSEINLNPKPVFYAVLLESLRKIAINKGYALAVHGTMASDMDLLAVAWTEDAEPHESLLDAFWDEIGNTIFKVDKDLLTPEIKPNGRLAYSIPIIGDWFVDLSIIPPVKYKQI